MNELIVKDNALINASYNLEVTEQRIILLAILHARRTGTGITSDSKLKIHAEDYIKHFGVEKHAAYEALKNAVNNLFERKFSYLLKHEDSGQIGVVKSRWVSRIYYVDTLGYLEITFAPEVVPLITRLEKHFTSYQFKQITQLTSKYAIRLYEILIAWREIGKTPTLAIDEFRYRLGLDDNEYTVMHNFKSRVLDSAIKQINQHTDIIVSYEQEKSGRTITGFQFNFKKKPTVSTQEPVSETIKLTEKQIVFFANKLAYDDTFASKHAEVGEEYADLEKRLIKKLADNEFIKKYSKDLERVGFK